MHWDVFRSSVVWMKRSGGCGTEYWMSFSTQTIREVSHVIETDDLDPAQI